MPSESKAEFGLGGSVILTLLDKLENHYSNIVPLLYVHKNS